MKIILGDLNAKGEQGDNGEQCKNTIGKVSVHSSTKNNCSKLNFSINNTMIIQRKTWCDEEEYLVNTRRGNQKKIDRAKIDAFHSAYVIHIGCFKRSDGNTYHYWNSLNIAK